MNSQPGVPARRLRRRASERPRFREAPVAGMQFPGRGSACGSLAACSGEGFGYAPFRAARSADEIEPELLIPHRAHTGKSCSQQGHCRSLLSLPHVGGPTRT